MTETGTMTLELTPIELEQVRQGLKQRIASMEYYKMDASTTSELQGANRALKAGRRVQHTIAEMHLQVKG